MRETPPPNPSAPIFQTPQPSDSSQRPAAHLRLQSRALTEQQVMNPPYNISNAQGVLSNLTGYVCLLLAIMYSATSLTVLYKVDVVHYNGLQMYDTRKSFPLHAL